VIEVTVGRGVGVVTAGVVAAGVAAGVVAAGVVATFVAVLFAAVPKADLKASLLFVVTLVAIVHPS
jgi:hypothetical protein